MTTTPLDVELPAPLARHIEEHRAQVEALRREYGDPQVALASFLRDHFTPEAFLEDEGGQRVRRSSWLEDDEPDEDAW